MRHDFIASHRLDRGLQLSAFAGSLVVGLAALASGLLAQNNDNGGILPGAMAIHTSGQANSHDTTLAVEGQLEGVNVDVSMATLHVSTEEYAAVTMAFGVGTEDAEFHTDGAVVAEQLPTGSISLQGSGALSTEIGLGLVMHSASNATSRAAFLVGSSSSQSLENLLAGVTPPFALIALGDLPSLDLEVFEKLLERHDYPGAPFRATIVFLSVGDSGEMHLAAVSGLSGGGELNVAFQ